MLDNLLSKDNGLILMLNGSRLLNKVWNHTEANNKSFIILSSNEEYKWKQALKKDPDILYMKEKLSDTFEAKLAYRAANCGHLVLAKLKSNNLEDARKEISYWELDEFYKEQLLLGISDENGNIYNYKEEC